MTEDEIIEKYGKQCRHINRKTLIPYEYEWTCFSYYNKIKLEENMNLLNYNEKKINFINRLKYAEQKIFCICVDVYKIYKGNDYDKLNEVLSTLKNKKLRINKILIEKYKDKLENPDFEQNHYSRTAEGVYKIKHDSFRLNKWLAFLIVRFLK